MEFKIGDRVAACYTGIGGVVHYCTPEIITGENKFYWITNNGNRIIKSSRKPKGCAKYDTEIYVLYTLEMQLKEEQRKNQREKRKELETKARVLVETHKLSLSQLQYIVDMVEE